MPDVGTAYVQIIPSAKGIKGAITRELGGEADDAGKNAGESIASKIAKTLGGALAALGVKKIISDSLDAGGAIQQSFGGLDTIYGEASAQAKQFAMEASRAGISANDYAEQAVSFGASLKQAFGGDTEKAVQAANTAIMDMTDNAAKMGTPIENIQSAYQGFAKQNYTMLDNLKLGYGGTKTEMERLLKDAEKISGVKYDISNLGDVYDAIHVIQGELGLTGVAAEEASSTLTGSFGAMKASFQNFLATLSTGGDVESAMSTLIQNASTYLFKNLIPMIGNIVKSIPGALNSALKAIAPMIGNAFGQLITVIAPRFLDGGIGAINKFILGMFQAIPGAVQSVAGYIATMLKFASANLGSLAESGVAMIRMILYGMMSLAKSSEIGDTVERIFNQAINLLPVAVDAIVEFADGILSAIPSLITTAGTLITKFAQYVIQNFPKILQTGSNLILRLVNGIMNNLPAIVSSAMSVVGSFLSMILKNLPSILQSGVQILTNLVVGILNSIPKLITVAGQAIRQFVSGIINNLPQIISQGIQIIANLVSGIIRAIPQIRSGVSNCVNAIKEQFSNINWLSIGSNIISGIASGISNGVGSIINAARSAATSAFNAAKKKLEIGSPSKLFARGVGRWIPEGIAVGIEKNIGVIEEAMNDLSGVTVSTYSNDLTSDRYSLASGTADVGGAVFNQTINNYSPQSLNPSEIARQTRNATQQMILSINGV